MQVAGHMHAVKRGFECRAMPAYEKPPALPEDNYCRRQIPRAMRVVRDLIVLKKTHIPDIILVAWQLQKL